LIEIQPEHKSIKAKKMITEHIKKIKAGEIDVVEYTKQALDAAKKINHDYSYFSTICEDEAISQAKEVEKDIKKDTKPGKLAGLIVSVKDNICVKDVESTAGSRILKGYKPLFDATVIERLKSDGAIIIGKTIQDEFGFGSFSTNVGLDVKTPKNPFDKERATGGSSGGSAGITSKAEFSHVSIAESTGGSIECPASFCGVVGFCPTYGRLSRYGLISYADSLDKIGIMAKNVKDIAPVLEVMSGFDEMDATSLKDKLDLKHIEHLRDAKHESKDAKHETKDAKHENDKLSHHKFKIGLIKESMAESVDKDIKLAVEKVVDELKSAGHSVEEVSLPITFKYGIPTYYIISTSEASTNLMRYCGLRYGQESEVKNKSFVNYFTEIRSEHFNEEAKRRIMLGTFARMAGYRDAYYIKATKVRTQIIQEYKNLFTKYDILISPTMPVVAPKFSEIEKMTALQNFMMDILTVGPNLAGIPHASQPIGEKVIGKHKMPIGMMANADHMNEGLLLTFMQVVEDIYNK
jgi:aspartyl-tRNA(Asn)/glutamyl-tRNA(Gln) amidotransferase subunit A